MVVSNLFVKEECVISKIDTVKMTVNETYKNSSLGVQEVYSYCKGNLDESAKLLLREKIIRVIAESLKGVFLTFFFTQWR